MTTRTRRRPQLQLEVLERREAPSSLGGGGEGFRALAGRQATAAQRISGSGRAVPTGQASPGTINGIVNGTIKLANLRSPFTGTIRTNVSPTLQFASGTATLVQDGSTNAITIDFHGPIRRRGSNLAGNLLFTIVGGKDQFEHASGSGRLNTIINVPKQSSTFTFTGTARLS